MPYRRYSRKRTPRRKRTFRKSYRKSGRRTSRYRKTVTKIRGNIFADTTLVNLNAKDTLNLGYGSTPGIGQYSQIDVYITPMVVGQPFGGFSTDYPTGVTTYGQFYENAIVHSSFVKIFPIAVTVDATALTIPSTNPNLPYQITIYPVQVDGLSPPPTFVLEPDEQPYQKTKLFNGSSMQVGTTDDAIVSYSLQEGNNVKSYVSNSMMTKKMLGYKDLADVTEVRCPLAGGQSIVDTLPQWIWGINVTSLLPLPAGATPADYTLGDFSVRCESWQKCQLVDRKQIV